MNFALKNEQSTYKHFNKLPFDVVDVDENNIVGREYNLHGEKAVHVGPKKYYWSYKYKKHGLEIYNFKARTDDVWLMGFPRSGTTLHCEMIWQIAHELDFEGAAKKIIDHRFPHIDHALIPVDLNAMKVMAEENNVDGYTKSIIENYAKLSLVNLEKAPGQRFIKSHLPISLTPPHVFEVGSKVIYCARNPKDVIVSMYNLLTYFSPDAAHTFTVDKIFHAFKNNLVFGSPYFENIKEAWAKRKDENFLFIFYEDTLKDKKQTMVQIANFLGKKLSEDQVDVLEEYLRIEKFEKNKSVNNEHFQKLGMANKERTFFGKGKAGGWRQHFSGDLKKEVNEWIHENLEGTDIVFPQY